MLGQIHPALKPALTTPRMKCSNTDFTANMYNMSARAPGSIRLLQCLCPTRGQLHPALQPAFITLCTKSTYTKISANMNIMSAPAPGSVRLLQCHCPTRGQLHPALKPASTDLVYEAITHNKHNTYLPTCTTCWRRHQDPSGSCNAFALRAASSIRR